MTTQFPHLVMEACHPYPVARNHLLAADQPADLRNTRWLTEVIERLSERELRDIVRTLAVMNPRVFEQELLDAGRIRAAMATQCPAPLTDHV